VTLGDLFCYVMLQTFKLQTRTCHSNWRFWRSNRSNLEKVGLVHTYVYGRPRGVSGFNLATIQRLVERDPKEGKVMFKIIPISCAISICSKLFKLFVMCGP
jgi:hypothetical protein